MKTVLVVDDELDIVEAVATLLEYEGYRVLSAVDGEAGLLQFEAERPDLLIVDWMMPKVDGLALIRAVRAEADGDCIPIILVSAVRPPAPTRNCSWEAFLHKPFSFDELLGAIQQAFEAVRSSGRGHSGELPG